MPSNGAGCEARIPEDVATAGQFRFGVIFQQALLPTGELDNNTYPYIRIAVVRNIVYLESGLYEGDLMHWHWRKSLKRKYLRILDQFCI